MLTREELRALAESIPADPDRGRLLATLEQRAAPLLAALPPIPRVKALLSRDGGICPDDKVALRFDPWSAEKHRCPRCDRPFSGDRHHRHWARAQHLWLAERMAELSLLGALRDDAAAVERALELYAVYEELYFALPNRDNVLGPSRLFFSTYLESLWLTSYLAGAFILREEGLLPEDRLEGVNRVAEEAATLIGDFNEGLSNRQTWHAAALTAIAAWFGDQELAATAIESRTGVLGHLADGFGSDGFWWEGENYHLFALRGLLQGIHWSRAVGYEILEDEVVLEHFRSTILAPSRSVLPDLTYPARRDSRYGVSLAEPPSLELWEAGRAWLPPDAELDAWLGTLYAHPASGDNRLLYDAWLHDAGRPAAATDRGGLSWWALTTMGPPLPSPPPPWTPASVLLPDQGLAVLRDGDRYASLECGRDIGGHGHPDRLHLTLFAGGMHWLPDAGTGSYVEPELEWYRSALGHNAPRLDGINAGGEDAWCESFDSAERWAWCRGRAGIFTRTVVAGPEHLIDILEAAGEPGAAIDLPWHFNGKISIATPGKWERSNWHEPFISAPERFLPSGDGPVELLVERTYAAHPLRVWLDMPGADLLRALAPGLPGDTAPRPFLLLRSRGAPVRWVTLLDPGPAGRRNAPSGLGRGADQVTVKLGGATVRYLFGPGTVTIEDDAGSRTLRGARPAPAQHRPLIEARDAPGPVTVAPRIDGPPALDGSLEGFEAGDSLRLEEEQQYRRSETPYNPECFRAEGWINWDPDTIYVAAAVAKPDVVVRDPSAAPLDLDNEPDDIHADGIQLHFAVDDHVWGLAAALEPGGEAGTRQLGTPEPGAGARGRWTATEDGYMLTLAVSHPRLPLFHGARMAFDLLVNEMQPGRLRRAGQLVWSGHGGWVYLRGDRHLPSEFGVLELS